MHLHGLFTMIIYIIQFINLLCENSQLAVMCMLLYKWHCNQQTMCVYDFIIIIFSVQLSSLFISKQTKIAPSLLHVCITVYIHKYTRSHAIMIVG